MTQESTFSGIIGLLKASCPAAIAWGVWPVVVYSLNGIFNRRARSHVGQEQLETFSPTLTHRYASLAVTMVALVVLVMAPRLYFAPNIMLGCIGHPVLDINSSRFSPKAPTASRVSSSQRKAEDWFFFTAVTAAKPSITSALDFVSQTNYSQSPEYATGHINQSVLRSTAKSSCHNFPFNLSVEVTFSLYAKMRVAGVFCG